LIQAQQQLAEKDESDTTLFGIPTSAGRVVYVVDISGSMVQTPTQEMTLDQTLKELILGIDAEHFNVISFNETATLMYRSWQAGTSTNRNQAVMTCKALVKEGPTNSYQALKMALSLSDVEMIYFITDGEPNTGVSVDTNDILSSVRDWNSTKGTRIFSVMVGVPAGSNVDSRLLYGFLKILAEQNGGKFIGR
jgi:uncharacterized protein with von Willebrand factor type A (vWA) domain